MTWTPNPSKILTAEMKAAKQQAELKDQFRAAIQSHVDGVAHSRDYHDGVTLASYDTPNQPCECWSNDAAAFVVWRTTVWLYAYAELDKALDGQRPVPTVEAFIAELPVIDWPEPAAA